MADELLTLPAPASNPGVVGLARTSLDGKVLTLAVAASRHPLHVRGLLDGSASQPATYAEDLDAEGVVERPRARAPSARSSPA